MTATPDRVDLHRTWSPVEELDDQTRNRKKEPMISTLAQFQGIAAAGGGIRPQDRDDYRRPIRTRMLSEARSVLLELHDAPPAARAALQNLNLADWPEKARNMVRAPRPNSCQSHDPNRRCANLVGTGDTCSYCDQEMTS